MLNNIKKIILITVIGVLTAGIASAYMAEYWKTTDSLIPRTTDTVDIGSSSKNVRAGYFSTLNTDTLSDGTLTINSGSITGGVDATFSGTITGDVTGDLTCTNCLNATEIEDIYVLNTTDTMTGDLTVEGSATVGDGTSPGDSTVKLYAAGVHKWTIGMDDDDSDILKVSESTDFSSDNHLTVNGSGDVNISGDLVVGGTVTGGGGAPMYFTCGENSSLDPGYEWSCGGNGETGTNLNVHVFEDMTITNIGITCNTGTGTAVVEIYVNGTGSGCSVSSGTTSDTNTCNVDINAGDEMQPYTDSDSGHSNCVVTWRTETR